MKSNDLLLLIVAGGIIFMLLRRGKSVATAVNPGVIPEPEQATSSTRATHHTVEDAEAPARWRNMGLALTEHGFALQSWDRWMALGPAGFDAALNEGITDPEEMVTVAFRKLYPNEEWPPKFGEPRFVVWRRIVDAIANSRGQGHRQGLRVVDTSS